MSRPVQEVTIATIRGDLRRVRAVFDSGSHFTIVRQSALPAPSVIEEYLEVRHLTTAAQGGTLRIVGALILEIDIGGRTIETACRVSPDLSADLIIGAGAMQEWDIAIVNESGRTRVEVGLDSRDPDVTAVL